jgi:hypothetical protein
MDAQSPQVRAILNRFGHVRRKSAHVEMAALARQFQRTVLDDIACCHGHIEDLLALRHASFVRRQRFVTTKAVSRQWVAHCSGRLRNLLERCSFVTDLPADLIA